MCTHGDLLSSLTGKAGPLHHNPISKISHIILTTSHIILTLIQSIPYSAPGYEERHRDLIWHWFVLTGNWTNNLTHGRPPFYPFDQNNKLVARSYSTTDITHHEILSGNFKQEKGRTQNAHKPDLYNNAFITILSAASHIDRAMAAIIKVILWMTVHSIIQCLVNNTSMVSTSNLPSYRG